jgi:hypothetical protein
MIENGVLSVLYALYNQQKLAFDPDPDADESGLGSSV